MKNTSIPRWLLAISVLCLLLTQASCSDAPQKFKATDITGGPISGEFELPDHNGKQRRLADFRGKLVVVFFGFTSCPDVCPTTLATLSGATKLMGVDASEVQVLMITVDPARDTRQVMANYVPSFNSQFIGLIPDDDMLKKVTGQFKVYINRNKPNAAGNYSVDHTTSSFVFDRQGRARLFVPHEFSSRDWADDLRALLASREG